MSDFTCQSFSCSSRKCCAMVSSHRYEWPEVVGLDGLRAKQIIISENPEVTVDFIRPGQGYFMDFCCNRVRIKIDGHGKVASTPMIG
ncbi:hypothetical protein ACJIZ3_019083 [Penstemon smallii]|uniref:Uncharacterized protein n=1 Tax=Penstemon smallii TaxID=265156 RepID=A0ABD3T0V5_9LAMI